MKSPSPWEAGEVKTMASDSAQRAHAGLLAASAATGTCMGSTLSRKLIKTHEDGEKGLRETRADSCSRKHDSREPRSGSNPHVF